jgi:glycosyltransferase involved in cell wall biosynthesis
MKLTIVIPVFNESNFIGEILLRVQNVSLKNIVKEIVVVDDFSTDGTREFLEKLVQLKNDPNINTSKISGADRKLDLTKIKIVFHEKNKGKGAALQSGFKQSTGDLIIMPILN